MEMYKIVEDYRRDLSYLYADASTDFRALSDFKIVCDDGTEFHTFRILLAARSKYFDALFRFEPEKRILNLPFEGRIMKIIINSLLDLDYYYNIDDFFKVYEAADYFQMDTLVAALQEYVVRTLSLFRYKIKSTI